MQKPTSIKRAEFLIWLSLAASTVLTVVERQMNIITVGTFYGVLAVYATICLIPYKIARGSNVARYVYAVLSVLGYVMLLSGDYPETPRVEVVENWIEAPFTALTLYWLFKQSSAPWFKKREA
jgi:uncharacterized protein CbrC (UPF0167 family)